MLKYNSVSLNVRELGKNSLDVNCICLSNI